MNLEIDNNLKLNEIQAQSPDKLTIQQFLSQRFSCEILFNLLSSGEKCIHHYHPKRKYRYYDPFTTAKTKEQDDLELEFRNQVRCFQACFIDDIENGGFKFPENLTKKEIIDDVKSWMKFAQMGKRDMLYKTYEKFILLLEVEKEIIVDKIDTPKIYGPNIIKKGILDGVHKKEIESFIDFGLICNKAAFEMEESIKKDYEKGDYSIKAKLNCNPPIMEKIEKKEIEVKLKEEKPNNSKNSYNCC